MNELSAEALYALDVLRFLALEEDAQVSLIREEPAPALVRNSEPLRDALEEAGEMLPILLDPDSELYSSIERVIRELDALIEILLWADDHHPSGRVYTRFPDALKRYEWSLVRRLAALALGCYGQVGTPFTGDWRMIFSR